MTAHVGKKIVHQEGRQITLVGTRPYVLGSGKASHLNVWEAPCKRCGQAFEITTPPGCVEIEHSKAFGVVHCPKHRIKRGGN